MIVCPCLCDVEFVCMCLSHGSISVSTQMSLLTWCFCGPVTCKTPRLLALTCCSERCTFYDLCKCGVVRNDEWIYTSAVKSTMLDRFSLQIGWHLKWIWCAVALHSVYSINRVWHTCHVETTVHVVKQQLVILHPFKRIW